MLLVLEMGGVGVAGLRPRFTFAIFLNVLDEDNLEHVANHVLEAELENLLAVEDLLRSRGQPTDSLQGVLEHLQSVTAAQSGKPATAGGFGRPEDEQPPTAAELRERLRIVKQAIRDHEAAGETDHARGATEVLNDLERELARLQ